MTPTLEPTLNAHITTIVSGGRPGVELGALTAATTAGRHTGGHTPSRDQDLIARFGLTPMPPSTYNARLRANMRLADATIVLTENAGSPRSIAVLREGLALQHPVVFNPEVAELQDMIATMGWCRLHIVGDSSRAVPDSQLAAHMFMSLVLTGEVPRG